MISLQSALAGLLFLAASGSAFDANECTTFVFRTTENALWHCGEKLPMVDWSSKYCDHSMGEPHIWPFAWASDHPDEWCDFMISTVRQSNEDSYPLTPNIDVTDTPGPNVWQFHTIQDWGCYVVENNQVTESYLVRSKEGEHASTVNTQCTRSETYFDYWYMNSWIRDNEWHDISGHVPAPCK